MFLSISGMAELDLCAIKVRCMGLMDALISSYSTFIKVASFKYYTIMYSMENRSTAGITDGSSFLASCVHIGVHQCNVMLAWKSMLSVGRGPLRSHTAAAAATRSYCIGSTPLYCSSGEQAFLYTVFM